MDTTPAPLRAAILEVPGARLHYEVRGSGPPLLMMPGGPADATTFRAIEDRLADSYTVVTYDPRGLSHSPLLEPLDESTLVATFANDAHRLIQALGEGRADVFASSGGACIALELIRLHGGELGTVILHEPPSPSFTADAAGNREGMLRVADLYAKDGFGPAFQLFAELIRMPHGEPPPPAPEAPPSSEAEEAMAMMQANMALFFGVYMRAVANQVPDLDAVRAAPCRVIAAVGEDSTGQLANEGGHGLARALGAEPAVFPGDHGGFAGRPEAFAARLLEVLGGR